jgi:hypothetical protein
VALLAQVVGGLVLLGALLVVSSTDRRAVVSGTLAALVPTPFLGRPDTMPASWVFAAAFHLVAALLCGYLLWRSSGRERLLPVHRWLPGWAAAGFVAASFVVALLLWVPVIAPPPGTPFIGDPLLHPIRWAFASGIAVTVAMVQPMLLSREPLRLASAGALGPLAVATIGTGLGFPPTDALLAALALVPAAAGAAAFSVSRRGEGVPS